MEGNKQDSPQDPNCVCAQLRDRFPNADIYKLGTVRVLNDTLKERSISIHCIRYISLLDILPRTKGGA